MAPIHVLHGQPTPEELAAVLAVVQARAAEAARLAGAGPAAPWNDRSRLFRPAVHPGVNAWRTSGWAS
ncbi:acyl-CoA carboxylase subunit epsilon [Kitasatospora sp. NPDC088861]|uniref:acyl-CoA carboxylase subunit epsilon n=1 Tax=Kitasatospora sp. NPDC088861 TaxID=3364078 RepID=UPI003828A4EF